jgi:hypothetical protein
MSRCLQGVVLMACVALAAACGKAVQSGGDPDAGDDSDDGSDGSDDDDLGDDIVGDDGTEADAAPSGAGLIIASSSTFTDAKGTLRESSTARAFFGDYQTESCEVELEDPECRVLACSPRTAAATFPEAGLIVIQVDTVDTATLTPAKGGAYNAYGADATMFPDGAEISVFAAGDDVPAFDVDLTAPFSIGFQGAVPTGSTPIAISAAAGHDMTWGGIDPNDTVHVTLSALPDGDNVRRVVDCSLAAGVGRLFLSGKILSAMPQGDLDFEARVETSDTVPAGDYQVTFTASVVARVNGDDQTADAARGTMVLGE